jgi:hypothetical protein
MKELVKQIIIILSISKIIKIRSQNNEVVRKFIKN